MKSLAPLPLLLLASAAPVAAQTTSPDTSLASVVAAERAFSALSESRGMREAFLANLADEGVRVHRDGAEPAVGAAAARVLLATQPAASRWEAARVDVARSGDFGYAYGTFRTDGGTGSYLRVWERGADGGWRVVLDVTNGPPRLRPAS